MMKIWGRDNSVNVEKVLWVCEELGLPFERVDAGGQFGIVDHDVTGFKVYPNNPESLAWGITKILLDENYRNYIRENAYKKVQEKYDWQKIAQQTKQIYKAVLGEYSKSFWA